MIIKPIPFIDNINPPFAYWDDAFSREELDLLQGIARSAEASATVGAGSLNNDLRRSKVRWLSLTSEFEWIYEKLGAIVGTLNSQFFRFDISGFGEDIQMTNYEAGDLGTYGWHNDGSNKGVVRKMSLVVQLSHPGEHEGGDLQIMHSNLDPITVEKARGRVALFPSYKLHRVTPVTAGSRQSLVCWLTGPSLR